MISVIPVTYATSRDSETHKAWLVFVTPVTSETLLTSLTFAAFRIPKAPLVSVTPTT